MYDNDPLKPLNVEIYCFNFPKQSSPHIHAWSSSDAGQTRCSPDHEHLSLIASHFAPGKTKLFSLSEFAVFIIKIYPGPLNNVKIIRSFSRPP